MEYNIILSRDHILIDSADGILLVDTGSPMSFHENGMIRLGDDEFQGGGEGDFLDPVPLPVRERGALYALDEGGILPGGSLYHTPFHHVIDSPLGVEDLADGTIPPRAGLDDMYTRFIFSTIQSIKARRKFPSPNWRSFTG